MRVSVLLAVAVVLLCTTQGTFASVATTSQTWTFDTDANPVGPNDPGGNVFGLPSATVAVDMFGSGWWDTWPEVFGSAQGWWDIGSGSINLTIPNRTTTDPNSSKVVTVWVKYWKDFSLAPIVHVSPDAPSLVVGSAQGTAQLVEAGPNGGAWYSNTWTFNIVPNPDFETITLSGVAMKGALIDEIRVDTSCTATAVPEPGTILAAMSILGPAGFLFRRKRA